MGEITKNTLKNLYEKQLSNKAFADKPKRMFVNELFNKNNWNGGDDIIRDFLLDVEERCVKNIYHIEVDDCYAPLIVHVDRVEDITFATIICGYDVYFFSWYKNRGCTEIATKNSKDLTEDEYVDLLNIISMAGYKFERIDI